MDFSHYMTNTIEWFCFEDLTSGRERDASVLVLGDKDTTAPFVSLLEPRVHHVSRRLDDSSYDYVVIPVLTKKVLRMFQGNLQAMFHTLTETWLKKGGSILIGLENALDLDRLTTGDRKEDTVYLRWSELETLRESLGKEQPNRKETLYYVTPDLRVPLHFYSDARMPELSEEDEKTALLIEENRFREFAPAYLYIYQPDGSVRPKVRDYRRFRPDYIKYNSTRKPEYAIKTLLYRDDQGKRFAVKAGTTPAANAHIESLSEKAEAIAAANPQLSVLRAVESSHALGSYQFLSFQRYPFVEGPSLSEILSEMIKDGVAPIKELAETVDLVLGAKDGTVQPANFDCQFDNVIMCADQPTLIDCEWVFQEPVDVRFLQYRILYYWYMEYRSLLAYEDAATFLRNFGFSKQELEALAAREQSFQEEIHGKDGEAAHDFLNDKVTVARFRALETEYTTLRQSAEELQREVKERDITIQKEREVNRLTQVHVANLTNVIKVHERDIQSLLTERDYYKARQSLKARVGTRLRTSLDHHFPIGSRKRKLLSYAKRTLRHPVKMLPMYFTEDGQNRIRGDFQVGDLYMSYGKVRFERSESPLISIVIPCYNQIHYTYQCLISIKENTDFEKTPYEVIIADDVSTDATREIGQYAENLVIARNKENMGFLKNCNQAAAIARGQYILFLNNDTQVQKNWLSSLVELMERDTDIGMVGSKLVYPDGRLQEAGGIIWSDGSGWNYGRLQDPADPEYNYVKEVDFISGAAIMIRTALWKEIGGFDERFAPAYYEDTDLAFEVRKHGKKVMFQPKSVVVHFEGISNGTDTSDTSSLKHYQVVNQEKFREKWAAELRTQCVNDGNPNPFNARERGQHRPCLLMIDHYVPTWDKDAGSKLDYQYIRLFLREGWRVKFLGDNFAHEEPYTSELEQLGVEVLYGPKLQADIWGWIERNKSFIQIAYLSRPHIAARYIDYIRDHTDMKILYHGSDLHSLRLMREYAVDHNEKTREEAEYWHGVEYAVMRKADMSYFPSEVEAEIVHKEDPTIHVKAITSFVYDQPAVLDEHYAEKQGLLFVGGFAHPPNKDGLLWFVQDILPKIEEKIPGVVLHVIGSHADDEVLALNARPDVDVLGFVSSEKLDEMYRKSRVVVVPLRFGAGVKGKVVEALHAGTAVVTTSCGAEGITASAQVLHVEDDPTAFAEDVIHLYQHPEEIEQMAHHAVHFIETFYSPDGAWAKIQDDFETGRKP
ncbi:MAG TPA: glycosyl transferase family 2 [Oribacterium sp.]|nr:glycosyl transferase family 2 [Oribacterium sp.]